MKIVFIFLLLALASATPQLDQEEQNSYQHLNPVNNAEIAEDKIHQKRTIFGPGPYLYGRTRHVGIHPLGFKYLLGYGPLRYNYVVKPAVTYLKPVLQTQGWKPIIKPVHLKPVVKTHFHPHGHVHTHPVVVKPAVVHTPVVEKPVVEVKPAVVVPQPAVPVFQFPNTYVKPFIPSPVLPAVLPQQPIFQQPLVPVNPTVLQPVHPQPPLAQPVVPQAPIFPLLHKPELLRPLIGGHFNLLKYPLAFQHPITIQHNGVPLQIPFQLPHLKPLLPHLHTQTILQPQPVIPHGNHLDVPLNNVLEHHHDHLHIDQPLHDHHIHLDQPHIHHGHLHSGLHLHADQHIHPEEPNIIHTEQHLHQDLPHIHPVHPAPQLPLYLPQHPNFRPGFSLQPIAPGNSIQTEFSATYPKFPLQGVHVK